MLNKKADGGLTAIIIILILIVFLGWLVNFNNRECNSNKDCTEESYCGSDFECHQIPIIEKTVVKGSYTGPTLIVSLTIISIVILFRWEKIFKKGETKTEPSLETPESYYTSQFQYKTK